MKGKTRISNLINKYFSQALNEQECLELLAYLEDPVQRVAIDEVMAAFWAEQDPQAVHFTYSERDAMLANLLGQTHPAKNTGSGLLYGKFLRYAAMLAVVLGIGVWAFYKSRGDDMATHTIAKMEPREHIPATSNTAILTLSDGQQILLDSIADGAIAGEGQTHIRKMKEGFLSYEALPESKTTAGNTEIFNTISTPKGKQYQIVLPDGTKAWLNAASSIKFPVAFKQQSREVHVTGEVYFEVQGNKNSPFFVYANAVSVQVIGTSFNINAYEDESFIETTLLEGAVKVKSTAQEFFLQPQQQAKLNKQTKKMDLVAVDAESAIAWKYGYFYSKNASLTEIMRQIERWFDVEVRYEGTANLGTFSGSIDKHFTLEQVLKIFELSDVKTKVEGRVITIML